MIEQLASLLLPIDALLAHEDFNPQLNAQSTLVSLFRNMWFLCILFHFTIVDDKEESAMEWQKPALARIAAKTPATVLEESQDSVASDVEYNSVIRQEYASTVSPIILDCSLNKGCSCTGDLQTQKPPYQADITTRKRHSVLVVRPDHISPHNARYGTNAI